MGNKQSKRDKKKRGLKISDETPPDAPPAESNQKDAICEGDETSTCSLTVATSQDTSAQISKTDQGSSSDEVEQESEASKREEEESIVSVSTNHLVDHIKPDGPNKEVEDKSEGTDDPLFESTTPDNGGVIETCVNNFEDEGDKLDRQVQTGTIATEKEAVSSKFDNQKISNEEDEISDKPVDSPPSQGVLDDVTAVGKAKTDSATFDGTAIEYKTTEESESVKMAPVDIMIDPVVSDDIIEAPIENIKNESEAGEQTQTIAFSSEGGTTEETKVDILVNEDEAGIETDDVIETKHEVAIKNEVDDNRNESEDVIQIDGENNSECSSHSIVNETITVVVEEVTMAEKEAEAESGDSKGMQNNSEIIFEKNISETNCSLDVSTSPIDGNESPKDDYNEMEGNDEKRKNSILDKPKFSYMKQVLSNDGDMAEDNHLRLNSAEMESSDDESFKSKPHMRSWTALPSLSSSPTEPASPEVASDVPAMKRSTSILDKPEFSSISQILRGESNNSDDPDDTVFKVDEVSFESKVEKDGAIEVKEEIKVSLESSDIICESSSLAGSKESNVFQSPHFDVISKDVTSDETADSANDVVGDLTNEEAAAAIPVERDTNEFRISAETRDTSEAASSPVSSIPNKPEFLNMEKTLQGNEAGVEREIPSSPSDAVKQLLYITPWKANSMEIADESDGSENTIRNQYARSSRSGSILDQPEFASLSKILKSESENAPGDENKASDTTE